MAGIASLLFPGDLHTLITGLLIIALIFTIAYSTRPSDASFRSYLTDLSLHQHLRHIHDQSRRSASPRTPSDPSLPTEEKGKDSAEGVAHDTSATATANGEDWDPDQTYPHVLTFANRILVSLRTPPYVRHDYALFSIVMVSHPAIACPNLFPTKGNQKKGNAASATACTKCAAPDASIHQSRTSWYVGAFGTWWIGAKDMPDKGPNQEVKGQHNAHTPEPEWGVLEMRSGDDKKKRREFGEVYGAARCAALTGSHIFFLIRLPSSQAEYLRRTNVRLYETAPLKILSPQQLPRLRLPSLPGGRSSLIVSGPRRLPLKPHLEVPLLHNSSNGKVGLTTMFATRRKVPPNMRIFP
jgi:hypothetical protein